MVEGSREGGPCAMDHCFRYPHWYAQLSTHAISSVIIPLPPAFVDYLREGGCHVPEIPNSQTRSIVRNAESDTEGSSGWEDDNGEDGLNEQYAHLFGHIQHTIDHLGGGVLPRLDTCSPKDAVWIARNHSLECHDVTDILLLLKASDVVAHALEQEKTLVINNPLDETDPDDCLPLTEPQTSECSHCSASYTCMESVWSDCNSCLQWWTRLGRPSLSSRKRESPVVHLILCPFRPSWHPANEFRCFVWRHQLMAICPCDVQTHYEYWDHPKQQHQLKEIVQTFVERILCVKGAEYSRACVVDVYVDMDNKRSRVQIINVHPWESVHVHSLLFDWEELHQWTRSFNTPRSNPVDSDQEIFPVLRFVDTHQPLQPFRYLPAGYPSDVYTIHKPLDAERPDASESVSTLQNGSSDILEWARLMSMGWDELCKHVQSREQDSAVSTNDDEDKTINPSPSLSEAGEEDPSNQRGDGDGSCMEQLLFHHRQERKQWLYEQIKLKKSIPKGDKKRKKEMDMEIALKEKELKERHERERMDLQKQTAEPRGSPIHESMVEVVNGVQNIQTTDSTLSKCSKGQKRRARFQTQLNTQRQQAEEEAKDQLNLAEKESTAFETLFTSLSLRIHWIPPDGDCLFNAVFHQLCILHGKESVENIQALRLLTVKYLREQRDHFLPFLLHEDTGEVYTDKEFDEYVETMSKPGTWGGHLEMEAMAQTLGQSIHVYQADGTVVKAGEEHIHPSPPKTKVLKISYHRHAYGLGEHYNSLIDQRHTLDETVEKMNR